VCYAVTSSVFPLVRLRSTFGAWSAACAVLAGIPVFTIGLAGSFDLSLENPLSCARAVEYEAANPCAMLAIADPMCVFIL